MSDNAFSHSLLTGRVAVITGAAQGIGEATARLFAARQAAGLLLVDRNAEKLQAVAASLRDAGVKVETVVADLQNLAEVRKVIPAAAQAFGRVDILANIAGSTERGSINDTDEVLFDRIFNINVKAPFFLIQDAVKIMIAQTISGTIVNMVSVNAHGGAPYLAPYSASKGALATLTKNQAGALVGHRIRVNGIMLGWTDTPGEHATLKQFHNAKDNWLEGAEAGRPFGRLLKPDEVARCVAYLASDESGLMNGVLLDFDQTVIGAAPFAGHKSP